MKVSGFLVLAKSKGRGGGARGKFGRWGAPRPPFICQCFASFWTASFFFPSSFLSCFSLSGCFFLDLVSNSIHQFLMKRRREASISKYISPLRSWALQLFHPWIFALFLCFSVSLSLSLPGATFPIPLIDMNYWVGFFSPFHFIWFIYLLAWEWKEEEEVEEEKGVGFSC